jgi:hypothetical protein
MGRTKKSATAEPGQDNNESSMFVDALKALLGPSDEDLVEALRARLQPEDPAINIIELFDDGTLCASNTALALKMYSGVVASLNTQGVLDVTHYLRILKGDGSDDEVNAERRGYTLEEYQERTEEAFSVARQAITEWIPETGICEIITVPGAPGREDQTRQLMFPATDNWNAAVDAKFWAFEKDAEGTAASKYEPFGYAAYLGQSNSFCGCGNENRHYNNNPFVDNKTENNLTGFKQNY